VAGWMNAWKGSSSGLDMPTLIYSQLLGAERDGSFEARLDATTMLS
jgi:hypothetical protein